MSKKRMIIVTLIILSVVVISLVILKLYQTYAIGNDMLDASSSPTIDIYVTESNTINVPANSYSNVFYMVNNTSPGTVNYGVGYSGTDVIVRVFSTSKDPASGSIEENGRKYVKLRIDNSSSTSKSVVLSTVLGYSNGGDLIPPDGVTLVTETYTSAAQYITNLYTSANKSTVANNNIDYHYATSVSLMNDRLGGTTEDLDGGNIRYYGANPNNYIYFNCSDYSNQTSSTCEKWRIIGIFDGKLKLIRNESIGDYSWDTSASTINDGLGVNEWSQADLMKLLNSGYETNTDLDNSGTTITVNNSLYWNSGSGTCYAGSTNVTTSCDFTSTGIKNDTTKNMISEVTWNLGGYDDPEIYSDQIYTYERGTSVVIPERVVCTGTQCNDTITRTTSWTGKIALMYPSDYGYATDFNSCSSSLFSYNTSGCYDNDWLYNSADQWSLTPDSLTLRNVFGEDYSDITNNFHVDFAFGVRPVLYLNSQLEIESGDGSESNPYKLSA